MRSHCDKKELLIELIPRTMHYKNVRAVLPRQAWHHICQIVHTDHDWHCAECGASQHEASLECHEKWDYAWVRRQLAPGVYHDAWVMKITDLVTLCHNCHMGKHILFAAKSGELSPVKRHLMTVYGLSDLQLWWKVQKAIARVKRLSQHSYELDLTYLNDGRFAGVHELIGRRFTDNEVANCRATMDD